MMDRVTLRRVKRRDRIARWVIVLGGMTIIAAVLAILALIVGVTAPLFRPARTREAAGAPLPATVARAKVLAVGIETALGSSALTAYVLTEDGVCTFVDLATGKAVFRQPVVMRAKTPGANVTAADKNVRLAQVEPHGGTRLSLLWSDGSASLIEIVATNPSDAKDNRGFQYAINELAAVPPEPGAKVTKALLRRSDSGTTTCVRLLSDGRVTAARQVVSEDLLGQQETKSLSLPIDIRGLASITAMTMDRAGTTLYAGTAVGQLARWQFDDAGRLKASEWITAFPDERRITALAMVFGDASLAVGDDRGELTTWFPVRSEGMLRLKQIHKLTPHVGSVREILPSFRTKSLLSVGEGGSVHLDHVTSERHLASIDCGPSLSRIGFAPRGNAVVAMDDQGRLAAWEIDAPYPEVSWKTLLGKVHYEGYDEPAYVWQTTGGDDFEAKLSLVPLISGTLKGTFYAMLLAVPLALAGAIYTSHFTTPGLKRVIKPTVEIMAAVPSVVLGFLVALWLAPIVEQWILAVFLSFVTLPAALVAFMACWQLLRRYPWARRLENGREFLVLVPVLVLGVVLAVWLAPTVESLVFGGDFRRWLYQSLGMRYDQRNCVVIAFGLGFAVIPIIFSIAEDSLSSVPHALWASSMALGASRWQTLRRVILPSASPGIFAGIMIGFGRAVGETMIVLMATGNTPILDWSPFDGMRTLSANIAVEITEAPVAGTLYRVLFLCGVLLFLLTFALNTAAELVRQRLRMRYGRL
jgi:phosphate transport system permease protein